VEPRHVTGSLAANVGILLELKYVNRKKRGARAVLQFKPTNFYERVDMTSCCGG